LNHGSQGFHRRRGRHHGLQIRQRLAGRDLQLPTIPSAAIRRAGRKLCGRRRHPVGKREAVKRAVIIDASTLSVRSAWVYGFPKWPTAIAFIQRSKRISIRVAIRRAGLRLRCARGLIPSDPHHGERDLGYTAAARD
jgi:hypothetical protein